MNPELGVLGVICLTCATLEKLTDNSTAKHVVTTFACAACVGFGLKLTYENGKKIVDSLSQPVKEGAKIGKEKTLEQIKKRSGQI
jgi:hypothetical protein